MTASNDWQTRQSDDSFWTRESATAQGQPGPAGPDYSGYDFYGQHQPTAAHATQAPPTVTDVQAEPTPEWVQPGVGYAQPPGNAQLMPYQATPTYGSHFYGPTVNHPDASPALVLGILSMSVFPPLGFLALYLGIRGRKQTQATPGVYANEGMLTAGIVLGAISSALTTLLVLFFFFMFVALAAY